MEGFAQSKRSSIERSYGGIEFLHACADVYYDDDYMQLTMPHNMGRNCARDLSEWVAEVYGWEKEGPSRIDIAIENTLGEEA